MFGNGRLAARSTLSAGLAGLALLAASPALASIPAAQHPAAQHPAAQHGRAATARPAAAGTFGTWHAAQRAAGFRLKKQRRLFGLRRTHPILVGKCQVTGRTRKRDVYAQWNSRSGLTYLSVDQNNSGGPCGNFGAARFLGTWRIQGRKARMYGFCGSGREPGCRSRKITLVLAWRAGSRYYVGYSRNEWRRTLVSFSRSLHFL